jgi:hypothetical protein
MAVRALYVVFFFKVLFPTAVKPHLTVAIDNLGIDPVH